MHGDLKPLEFAEHPGLFKAGIVVFAADHEDILVALHHRREVLAPQHSQKQIVLVLLKMVIFLEGACLFGVDTGMDEPG